MCIFKKVIRFIYDKTLIHLDDNSSSFEAISQVLDCFQSFSVFTLYKNMVNNGKYLWNFWEKVSVQLLDITFEMVDFT